MSADSAVEFFAPLGQRGHGARLVHHDGTVRFDLAADGRVEHWYLTIAKGELTVSNDDGPADAVISGEKAVVDGVLRGEINAVAATLRGVLAVSGNWDLVLLCQRLFPGPPAAPAASEGSAR